MKGRLVAAMLAGMALGVAGTAALISQPEARGQQGDRSSRWEYKVILISTFGNEVAAAMTEQYNKLAAEGWEYLGPVVDQTYSTGPSGAYTGNKGAFVAFRRPRGG